GPDGDGEVELQQPEEVHAARQREWAGQQNVRRVDCRAVGDVEQPEDDDEHDGHDYQQSLARALLVLVLSAPLYVVARGQLHLARDTRARFVNEAANVATPHVQKNGAAKQSVLARNHRRPLDRVNRCELSERNGRSRGRRDWQLRDCLWTAAELRRVAHAHRKATTPLDRDGQVRLAYPALNRS